MYARDRATSSSAPVPPLSLLPTIRQLLGPIQAKQFLVLLEMLPKSAQSRSKEQLVTWALSSHPAAAAMRVKKQGCLAVIVHVDHDQLIWFRLQAVIVHVDHDQLVRFRLQAVIIHVDHDQLIQFRLQAF